MFLIAIATFVLVCAAMTGAQTINPSPEEPKIQLTAENIERDGEMLRLRGRVVITGDSMQVRADEADYNPATGEADVRGSVRLKILQSQPAQ